MNRSNHPARTNRQKQQHPIIAFYLNIIHTTTTRMIKRNKNQEQATKKHVGKKCIL
jgi:hypothetical protein